MNIRCGMKSGMNLNKKPLKILIFSGFNFPKSAQNKTRTCTPLRALVPETSVSTDFTIWAFAFRLKALQI